MKKDKYPIDRKLDRIDQAFKDAKGGKYHRICCRRIGTHHCYCFARGIEFEGVILLRVKYMIDGKEAVAWNGLVDQMLYIAYIFKRKLAARTDKKVTLWTY